MGEAERKERWSLGYADSELTGDSHQTGLDALLV